MSGYISVLTFLLHFRYIFDVGSDVLVYLVAWVVLAGDPNWDRAINPGDASSFRVGARGT